MCPCIVTAALFSENVPADVMHSAFNPACLQHHSHLPRPPPLLIAYEGACEESTQGHKSGPLFFSASGSHYFGCECWHIKIKMLARRGVIRSGGSIWLPHLVLRLRVNPPSTKQWYSRGEFCYLFAVLRRRHYSRTKDTTDSLCSTGLEWIRTNIIQGRG